MNGAVLTVGECKVTLVRANPDLISFFNSVYPVLNIPDGDRLAGLIVSSITTTQGSYVTTGFFDLFFFFYDRAFDVLTSAKVTPTKRWNCNYSF